MSLWHHHKPWSISTEPVFGCNKQCEFCAIHAVQRDPKDRKLQFADLSLVKQMAADLAVFVPEVRYEIVGRGEPTLHPDFFEYINIFRTRLPKAQLMTTTNGVMLIKHGPKYVKELFRAGLNILNIDTYSMEDAVAIRAVLELSMRDPEDFNPIMSDYYNDKNPLSPYRFHSHKIKAVVLMDDISAHQQTGKKIVRTLVNVGGNVRGARALKHGILPVRQPLQKKCSRPFREMFITYDGVIPLCCQDWCREYPIAKFPLDGDMAGIWNSDEFNVARKFLATKNRAFIPCHSCNYNGGFRLGFIKEPDGPTLSDEYMRDAVIRHIEAARMYRHPYARTEIFPTNSWRTK